MQNVCVKISNPKLLIRIFQGIQCQGPCPCKQNPLQYRPFSPCQCCEANPPARCGSIRMALPCDNAQFQAMCDSE